MSSPTGWIQVHGFQVWLDTGPTLSVLQAAEHLADLRGQRRPDTLEADIDSLPVKFAPSGPELDALLCGGDTALTAMRWRRLIPTRAQTLPLRRWQTRGQRLEARLHLKRQERPGQISGIPRDTHWSLSPRDLARGMIHAAYDLSDTDLNTPGVITRLGARAQLLARCARRIHDGDHYHAVSGGHGLLSGLIAARWTGQGHLTLSRRELLHGVITLNLISALGQPQSQGERIALLSDTLLWQRLQGLIHTPHADEPIRSYLGAVAQLQRALPGISLHRPDWAHQIVCSAAHMTTPAERDPANLESLEAWWLSAPLTCEFAELGEERRLSLSSAPTPWTGQWQRPGVTTKQREEQRAATILGVNPEERLDECSGWTARDGGISELFNLSALMRLSTVTGVFDRTSPFPRATEADLNVLLPTHLERGSAIGELHTGDWERTLNMNQTGAPLAGYETLYELVALHSGRVRLAPPEAAVLRRLPTLLRERLNEAARRDTLSHARERA